MAERARQVVRMREFAGMQSNADSHDIDPSKSVKQTNCTSLKQGELTLRHGLREVSFDATS
jgi:hypothetical protein